ncbi:MAG: glycosyltransferase family 2 protein [Lewinella sp.]
MEMQFTVIICTYRREELLEITLKSLVEQTISEESWELLIVDNAGRPSTREVANRYGARYVMEERTGLSHARNRGIAESSTPWVIFLDDDIRAPTGLLERFAHRLQNTRCAVVGGPYRHWFRNPPPTWLLKYYAEPKRASDSEVAIELDQGKYLSGCVLAVRRDAVVGAGGFEADLGMSGMKIGYGEEDFLQDRIRELDECVLYDPDIWIEHMVQPYKYTMRSRLAMAHAQGRSHHRINPEEPGRTTVGFLYQLLLITIRSLPFNVARWMLKPGYVWQHMYLDTVTKYCFAWGRYRAHAENSKLSQ